MNIDRNLPIPSMSAAQKSEHDDVDLRQIFGVLWGGRYKVLLSILLTLTVGLIYLVAKAPVYEANGLVQVEQDDKSLSSSLGDLSTLFGAPVETEAEIEILKSRMVLGSVVDNLNLEISATPNYFPLIGRFVAQHGELTGEPRAPIFGLDRYAWGGEHIEVSTLDLPTSLVDENLTLVAARPAGSYILLDSDDKLILRGKVGEKAIGAASGGSVVVFVRDLKARPGTRFNVIRFSRQDVFENLAISLNIAEQSKQSGVIGITADGKSPLLVTNIVKEIEDSYLRQNVERRSAEAEQSLEFLQKQLPDIRRKVDAAQAGLNAYQMKQGSVDVTKETDIVLQQSVDLETQRLELEQKRQEALQKFTPKHPVIQAIDAQIGDIQNRQEEIKKKTEKLPETQQEILSLMMELQVNTGLYTALLNSAQQLQVAKAGTVGNVRIIDYPLTPNEPTKPVPSLVLALSVMMGFVIGVLYLFAEKALFRGVDSPDEVEKALGLPTYAAIPFVPSQLRIAKELKRKGGSGCILADIEPDNPAIEALRSLRTSLQFALLESGSNVVMFTGPTPGLGKSFVSINLGAVVATSGKRVAVVDADLRRGHLHEYFGESASPGLSDYVVGNADLASIIRKTSVDGLFVVKNGTTPPNPAELLLHEKFVGLIDQLSKSFDLVIIDTPPVLPVADAGIVGRLVPNVLIVLKEGEHPLRMIEDTVRRLRSAGVNPRGVLFNQVGVSSGGYGYYYNSYSYAYNAEYKSSSRS